MSTIQDLIDGAHEAAQEVPRAHLGCSQLGHACDRWLWLSFRLAVIEKFPGRILRLFRRGQLEERTVVADLQAVGMKITNTGANQSRVHFGWHVSGSVDGVIESGVPDSGGQHILEIKTASLKKFKEMQSKGLQAANNNYWVQVHLYMAGKNIAKALFVMICKDNDEIYTELVPFDKKVADKAIERGHRIVQATRPPAGISTDPTWYECKFCAGHDLCHGTRLTKEVNCRTCAHSTPHEDGTWHCANYDAQIPDLNAQLAGCEAHVIHPDIVPPEWQFEPAETGVIWLTPHGKIHNAPEGYLSTEIVANAPACAQGVRKPYEQFGARVVA